MVIEATITRTNTHTTMVRAEGREHDLKTKKNINTVLTHFKDNEVVAAKMDVKLWLNQALIIDILTVSVKNDLSE